MMPSSEHDPLEAILALNIGDFIAENLISEELLERIHTRTADEPHRLYAQIEELIQIYSIDKTLGILGLDAQCGFLIYDSIAASLAGLFEMDACHFFHVSKQANGEETLGLSGTSVALDASSRWEIGTSGKASDFLCDAYRLQSAQGFTPIASQTHWRPIERLKQAQTQAVLAAPLKQGARSLGVLLLESYRPVEKFTPELLQLAESTAHVLVTSLGLQQLVSQAREKLQNETAPPAELLSLRAQMTESIADLGTHQQRFLEDLSSAVDARHHFTQGYSRRVGLLARRLAEQLQLNEKSVDLIEMAGLLGSIGKVRISNQIIGKKGALSPSEWDSLREHPNMGVSLLMKINFIGETAPYVQTQNERWDGSGAEGLRERNIPLGGRILGLANAYEAMRQERPYRQASLDHTQAVQLLKSEVGKNWDPLVFAALEALPQEWRR